MGSMRVKLGVIGVLGLLAPLWWTWAVSNLAYGLYIASGSPARPSQAFAWFLMLAPPLVLGAIAAPLVARLRKGGA